jgi:hypothetical protein
VSDSGQFTHMWVGKKGLPEPERGGQRCRLVERNPLVWEFEDGERVIAPGFATRRMTADPKDNVELLAPEANVEPAPEPPPQFMVDLPAGGRMPLRTADEMELWQRSARRYSEDYGLEKANDRVLLGAILSQQIAMYRAQMDLADEKKANQASQRIERAAEEIRKLEKALGIDKKTREAGGQHTVVDYVTRLKRAAHSKGVHISERVKAYEALAMEARWKIRVLRNADEEDRRHHGLTPETFITWLERELHKLEERDKGWAKEQGRIFVGRL